MSAAAGRGARTPLIRVRPSRRPAPWARVAAWPHAPSTARRGSWSRTSRSSTTGRSGRARSPSWRPSGPGATAWSASRSASSTASSRATSTRPAAGSPPSWARTRTGLAFVPNTTTGVSTVLASRRFRPGDELLACDHEYNATLNALRAAAARDGATVVIVRVPFPVADPSQVVEAFLEAVTPRTRLALVSHVTSPTALVMPVAALVRELDRRGVDTLVDGAHAPGDDAGGPGRAGGGVLDRQRAQVAVRAEGLRRPPRPRRPPGRDPAAGGLPRRERRSDRSLALPPGLRLDRHGRPLAYLAMPAAIRFVGGLHEDGWSGLMAANAALARVGRDRLCEALGVPRPPRTRCSARWRRCRCPTLRRPRPRRSGSRPRCSTRTGSRSRCWRSRSGRRSGRAKVRRRRSSGSAPSATTGRRSTRGWRSDSPRGSAPRAHRGRCWGGCAGADRGLGLSLGRRAGSAPR